MQLKNLELVKEKSAYINTQDNAYVDEAVMLDFIKTQLYLFINF